MLASKMPDDAKGFKGRSHSRCSNYDPQFMLIIYSKLRASSITPSPAKYVKPLQLPSLKLQGQEQQKKDMNIQLYEETLCGSNSFQQTQQSLFNCENHTASKVLCAEKQLVGIDKK